MRMCANSACACSPLAFPSEKREEVVLAQWLSTLVTCLPSLCLCLRVALSMLCLCTGATYQLPCYRSCVSMRAVWLYVSAVVRPLLIPSSLLTHTRPPGQEPENFKHWPMTPPISLSTTFKQPTPGKTMGYEYSRGGTRDSSAGPASPPRRRSAHRRHRFFIPISPRRTFHLPLTPAGNPTRNALEEAFAKLSGGCKGALARAENRLPNLASQARAHLCLFVSARSARLGLWPCRHAGHHPAAEERRPHSRH